jgi:hypothetical protein
LLPWGLTRSKSNRKLANNLGIVLNIGQFEGKEVVQSIVDVTRGNSKGNSEALGCEKCHVTSSFRTENFEPSELVSNL